MSLFTDGRINGIPNLLRYENSVLQATSIEGIDVGGKMDLAQEEIGQQLLLFILRHPLRDTRAAVRRMIGLSDVVITDALQRWHALKTLTIIYRDAYNNQLNDRYLGKWTEYDQLSERASTDYLQIGVGLVGDPVPKAANPVLTSVTGDGAGATYYGAVSWVNGSGQEGALSDVGVNMTMTGTLLAVFTTSPPPNAVGWNVYIGTTADNLTLQNGSPNSVGDIWVMPAGGVAAGKAPSAGQTPELFLVHDRRMQRG